MTFESTLVKMVGFHNDNKTFYKYKYLNVFHSLQGNIGYQLVTIFYIKIRGEVIIQNFCGSFIP